MIDRSLPSLFSSLSALSDPMRCRLLLLVEKRELSVSELRECLQLPQSTVSRHLKALSDEGLLTARSDGASNRYSLRPEQLETQKRRLWTVVRERTIELASADEDARRLAAVLSERRRSSQSYFSTAAGQWDRIRSELFGDRSHLFALLALLDNNSTVADLGCGTGLLCDALSPHVRTVIGVDSSAAMLAAARKRLADCSNVELRRGDIAALPIDAAEVDVAILNLALVYIDEPVEALREAARAVRPGGKLLVVEMLQHDRDEIAREMGHAWKGFMPEMMSGWIADAGFTAIRTLEIPPDPAAKGPSLFVATAVKPSTIPARKARARSVPRSRSAALSTNSSTSRKDNKR